MLEDIKYFVKFLFFDNSTTILLCVEFVMCNLKNM